MNVTLEELDLEHQDHRRVKISEFGENFVSDDNWFPSTELIELLLLRMTCVNKGKRTKERSTLFPCHTREPNPSMFEFRNHMNLVSHVAKKRKTVILASSIQFSAAIEYESSKSEIIMTYNAIENGVDSL